MAMVSFEAFLFSDEAEALAQELQAAGLTYRLVPIDLPLVGSPSQQRTYTQILVEPSQMAQAQALKQTWLTNSVQNLGSDYYLYQYTDEELYEITTSPQLWSIIDQFLARQILENRGLFLSDSGLELWLVANRRRRFYRRLLKGSGLALAVVVLLVLAYVYLLS